MEKENAKRLACKLGATNWYGNRYRRSAPKVARNPVHGFDHRKRRRITDWSCIDIYQKLRKKINDLSKLFLVKRTNGWKTVTLPHVFFHAWSQCSLGDMMTSEFRHLTASPKPRLPLYHEFDYPAEEPFVRNMAFTNRFSMSGEKRRNFGLFPWSHGMISKSLSWTK